MLAALALLGAVTASAQRPGGDDYRIKLKNRTFTPPARAEVAAIRSARGGAADDRVHFYAQFETLPTAPARARIASAYGIDLLSYVPANTYVASTTVAGLSRLSDVPRLRWAGPIEPADKIAPELARGNIGRWARAGGGRIVLMVQGHPDVPSAALVALAEGLGGDVVDVVAPARLVTAIFAPGRVNQLARTDAVQYVDVVPAPLGEANDGARVATNAATVNGAPYNLNGAGVNVLVFDSGIVDTAHGDFAGRVIQLDGDASETTRNHSTHVSGTVLGDGSQSNQNDSAGNPNGGAAGQWAGMAPAASLRSFGLSGGDLYNNAGDLNGDFTTALTAAGGTDLATMSLGNNVVLNSLPCSQLGDYTGTAIVMDQIVRGSIGGQQLVYFNAAGNERGGAATCGSTYSTISSPATAKNTIVVGATNSNDNTMTGFSSWGPTDDGRLKPDIVGPGCQSTGDGGVTSTGFLDGGGGDLDPGETQNTYVVMCGTSMATPASAGSMALVVQRWKTLYGAATRPLGHTAKAIFVHTATDLGNAGPDFQFGYGHVNAQAAVDLVNADASESLIIVGNVDQGDTDSFTFNSDGAAAPRVTLVWSDPPAAQLAATTLVNDLDLRAIDPDGVVHRPFVLDPANPANAATRGNDATNNVEMVVATAAKAGTWQVTVGGTTVPTGPQQYTLITPEDAVLNRPPVADADGPYVTQEGVDVALDATASSDPDGDPLTYAWDFDADGFFDDATGASPSFDLVGQDGVFTVAVRVTDSKGAFDTDTATVTVTNVAPSVTVASDSPKPEGDLLTVTGVVSDPGWLEVLTATVDWGDGTAVEAVSGVLENVRPNATLTYSATHTYGDNGTFTVTVCGFDDDTSTCEDTDVTITNVDPTVAIDKSGATLVNGVPTIFGTAGEPVPFSGNATDPGSDDLTFTWDWGDGTSDVFVSLVNPPNPDPLPSPTLQPRDVTDDRSHTFGEACLYDVELTVVDDDGGSGDDAVQVIIVGNAELVRSAGYWQQQYAPRPGAFSDAQLLCFLEIVGHMSTVFHEEVDASTIALAREVLTVRGSGGDMRELLDRQLLAAWLNFANGAIALDELVDTDGNGTLDSTFWAALQAAEAVRLDPTATRSQLEAQKNILERINLRDE